ncbi:uncharacterized protein LOC143285544 [Babylonia areolata]|uniref:uncharacterized protein LOC143285544 n=1 Tax=Babylonia areolata TaxID=304850 RepID=UPI003FD179AA
MRKDERGCKPNTVFSRALLALVFLQSTAANSDTLSTPDTIAVCDGEAASFSWPCDLAYDLAKVMTLTFKGFSTKGQQVAAIDGAGRVDVSEEYSSRVTARGTTGVRLSNVGISDSGVYLTTATFANGTIMEREFTLNVQVPPLLKENQLTVVLEGPRSGCQSVRCGSVLFPGFPALSFHWQTPEGTQQAESPRAGLSMVHGCPLAPGNYTCRVTGSALTCGKHYTMSGSTLSLSASLRLSADTSELERAASSLEEKERREMVLVIVVPIVAVMTPLLILGVWLLSHAVTDCPCSQADPEDGLSSASLLQSVQRSSSTVASPSAPNTEVPLSSDTEEEGAGGQGEEEGGAGGEGEENADQDLGEDTADPTVPLMDAESLPTVSVSLGDDDDDGSETRL